MYVCSNVHKKKKKKSLQNAPPQKASQNHTEEENVVQCFFNFTLRKKITKRK